MFRDKGWVGGEESLGALYSTATDRGVVMVGLTQKFLAE